MHPSRPNPSICFHSCKKISSDRDLKHSPTLHDPEPDQWEWWNNRFYVYRVIYRLSFPICHRPGDLQWGQLCVHQRCIQVRVCSRLGYHVDGSSSISPTEQYNANKSPDPIAFVIDMVLAQVIRNRQLLCCNFLVWNKLKIH